MLTTAKEFEDRPILFIAVNSGTPREEVISYARKHNIDWPIIVDVDRQFEQQMGVPEISLKNIHQVRLRQADGKITRGDWSDLGKSAEKALQNARWKVDPATVPESLKTVWRFVEFGIYAPASAELTKVASSRVSEEREAAQRLLTVVMEGLEKEASAAWELGTQERYLDAHFAFLDLQQRFKGYDIPKKYVQAAEWLAKRPGVKKEVQAAKMYDAIKGRLASPDERARNRALGRLRTLTKSFSDTRAGRQAQELLDQATAAPASPPTPR